MPTQSNITNIISKSIKLDVFFLTNVHKMYPIGIRNNKIIFLRHFPESRELVQSGRVKSKILLISETDYKRRGIFENRII
jgi:hypothetical protein